VDHHLHHLVGVAHREAQRLGASPRAAGALEPPHAAEDVLEAPRPSAATEAVPDGLLAIDAPTIGIFYRAEGPGRAPFVEVGSTVEPETTVCIIEVMKMMNSVPAGVAGTIVEICQENGQPVEYGQPLFRVRPA
jgi:acetyl-CoA carboxylase biotin carboxyl carrier protein